MAHAKKPKVQQLIDKGVRIASPDSVEIGEEIDADSISGSGVEIYAGSKIFGDSTFISSDAKIGLEAPATVKNCQVGPGVELKGGFFEAAVFLARSKAGLGAHVREASIFEEQASIAHTVGTKHTILFPFVTLGSLINFCDCLMAGGSSRKHHSEVGSSYVHFNFTPQQDKATASLIGDVPHGVLLNQAPIFLGGQGGIVGPCRLAYGTTVAAGTILRKDELRPGRLLFGGMRKDGSLPYQPGRHPNHRRVVVNNIIYIANLIALNQWYRHVRSLFISEDFPEELLAGLREKLSCAISERVNRLEALCQKIKSETPGQMSSQRSAASKQRQELAAGWLQLRALFDQIESEKGDQRRRDAFLETVHKGITETGRDYVSVIRRLPPSDGALATVWLQGIVDHVVGQALNTIPSFQQKK